MANGESKGPTGVNRRNPWSLVFILALVMLLIQQLWAYLSGVFQDGADNWFRAYIWENVLGLVPLLEILAIILSALFIVGIFVFNRKTAAIRAEEEARFQEQRMSVQQDESPSGLPGADEELYVKNKRWEEIEQYIETENPSDWRHAIMEADILLDEMLSNMGYHGEGVGEKLKQAQGTRFHTLDKAWEAHKVRNALAHEGSKYTISQREAKRVVDLFRQVFEEFNVI